MLKVKNIKYDSDFSYGCETCDYGSEYISNIEFDVEDYGKIKIETNQMYEYTLTESDFMKLLSNSNNVDEFYKNMFNLIKNKGYDIESRISLQDMEMKINGKQVDILKSCKLGKVKNKGKE